MFDEILKLTITSLSMIAFVSNYLLATNLTFAQTTSAKIDIKTTEGLALSDVVSSKLLVTKQQKVVNNPEEIARQITVRVLTDPSSGSGIIINRKGDNYTVLTNNHVVADTWDNRYTVLTADGLIHQAHLVKLNQFANLDLAIVQFSSRKNYKVAEIGNVGYSSIGKRVYAAGFPNYYWLNSRTPVNTRDWGLKALKITKGTIEMFPNISLFRGYQLGYTNDVENGMSGGPVLDAQGRLIGINGRAKHPFNGINTYVFIDGSKPSQEKALKMEALSWAIPITTVSKLNLFSN